MANLLDILKRLGAVQQSGPALIPLPTKPVPTLQGWLTGQHQQHLQNWQAQILKIQAQNEELRAEFQQQQQQARLGLAGTGLGQLGAGLSNFFKPGASIGSVGGGLAGIAGGVGTLAGAAIGGPTGAAVAGTAAALGTFGNVLAESIDKLRNWTKAVVDSNLQLSTYSPQMTEVKVTQQVYDILRSQRQGEALAPSAAHLVEQKERFTRNFTEPVETRFQENQNQQAGKWYELLNAMQQRAAEVPDLWQQLLNYFKTPPAPKQQDPLDYIQQYGKPARFNK